MEMLGLFLPVLIDVLNRKIPNQEYRFWVSASFCVIFGIFFNWLDTSFQFANAKEAFNSISLSISAVFTLAQISYKAVWENAPVRVDLGLKAETPKSSDNLGDGNV